MDVTSITLSLKAITYPAGSSEGISIAHGILKNKFAASSSPFPKCNTRVIPDGMIVVFGTSKTSLKYAPNLSIINPVTL